jgi:hypothetical protein
LTSSDYPATIESVPAYNLADIKANASAGLADPKSLVEWNLGKSVEIVSESLGLDFERAMQFILEAIGDLDPACFCETISTRLRAADVYQHHARQREWYVKLALIVGTRRVLSVVSFHPSERPMRPAGVRVTIP